VLVAILLVARSSHGQVDPLPQDLAKPILMINGQGHTAPLRALAFTPGGDCLLSGGLDKLVHVWEFRKGRLRLERTIRPPIWNNTGRVYAVAASPVAGRRVVAVAGHSVLGAGGRILVYRLPPPDDPGPVELLFELPQPANTPGVNPRAHQGVVNGLTFSRNGRYLASCGEDRTIRIWNVEGNKDTSVRVLCGDDTGVRGHWGPVTGVAFLDEEGNRLVSAGGTYDGSLRLWDLKSPDSPLVRSRILREELRKSKDGKEFAINALTAVPNGPYVAIGRENGVLQCYNNDLTSSRVLNPRQQGLNLAVEALAMSADGKTLAAIVLRYRPAQDELLRTECKVILKSLPDGQDKGVVRTTGDVAGALAFSPDGLFLAMGGGAVQEIAIKDLDPAAAQIQPAIATKGPGTTLWDVAFVDVQSKPTVAYVRKRPLGPEVPVWEAFDFLARRFVAVDPAARLDRAIIAYDGRTIATPGLDRLEIQQAQGAPVIITLDRQAGRWTSYTFIPGNPAAGHAKPTLAVGGSDGEISIYTLDGRRTRVLRGHSGLVYGIAPSPDGKWLATASADQTIRLWSLVDCDSRPKLGARLQRDPQGQWIVREVSVRSPAQVMGLMDGDRVEKVRRGASGVPGTTRIEPERDLAIERLDAEIEAIEPGSAAIVAEVGRGGVALPRQSTLRSDRPALNLLPGTDGEWIVWMPESYYDTSIAGDSRLLGWHVNKIQVGNQNLLIPQASEFHPMADFAKRWYNPQVIRQVIEMADPPRVLAGIRGGIPVPRKPPEVRLLTLEQPPRPLGTHVTVPDPVLTLRIDAEAAEGGTVRSIAVFNGPMPYKPDVFPQGTERTRSIPNKVIDLWRQDNPLVVEVVDELGVKGKAELFVQVQRPLPVPLNKPRLVLKAIGVGTFAGVEPIQFAESDVATITAFLEKPGGDFRFDRDRIDRPVILDTGGRNARATTPNIGKIVDDFIAEAKQEKLGRGDTVFLVINSHVLSFDKEGSLVLSSEARRDRPADAGIPTGKITEALKYLTDRGCFVVLFLDGIHTDLQLRELEDFRTWVRELVYETRVVVCVASKQARSDQLEGEGIGVFAKAILESIDEAAGALTNHPSLEQFRNILINRVEERRGNTSRQQADVYYSNIDARRTPFFDPQPRPVENLAAETRRGPARPR
jgi:WD40 repeat protein